MTKEELLDLIDSLRLTTQYYCDKGSHSGSFKIEVGSPYIATETWDRLQTELKGDSADGYARRLSG
jgi:hypothetical protein